MEIFSLNQFTPYIDDFSFSGLGDCEHDDAIVICNPLNAQCESPVFLRSNKSLEEHIQYVQTHNLKKAIVVAENICFLPRCPSLEYLWIIPAVSAKDFDYSPLYEMPNILWLQCETEYGPKGCSFSDIDYSRIRGLRRLIVSGAHGHHNICDIKGLKTLYLSQGQPKGENLTGVFDGDSLENLSISQSPIRSLEGIQQARHLLRLELSYNRRLEDISMLSSLKDSLVWLDIENCAKIRDFSVLDELHNLEVLRLRGSNSIPAVSFVNNMPNLKFLVITMNIADGDLSLCERIPYVGIRNRKHYSHKDQDFSKYYLGGPIILSLYE